MERVWKDLMKAAIIGFVVPGILLTVVLSMGARGESPQETEPEPTEQTESIHTTAPPPSETTQPQPTPGTPVYHILVLTEEGIVEMELESYVLGVVLAEVPASFEIEALKAQAVAARTAALYICQSGRHAGAVCASFGCCQAYISQANYFAIGGTQERLDRVQDAVIATVGQVMTYEGGLICAAYFSCSGGSTEDAVAVWGSDVPYLQAVESPGEEFASVFADCVTFTPEKFQQALCVRLEGEPATWFGEITYTDGGGVATLMVGDVAYRGTTLRILLGLRSTFFTVSVTEGTIIIETRGYGHRVGMSQYGAQAMALAGSGYEEILCHYYQGAGLSNYMA